MVLFGCLFILFDLHFNNHISDTFRVHFGFKCGFEVEIFLSFSFGISMMSCSIPFVEKMILSPLYYLCNFVKNQLAISTCVYFGTLYSVPLTCVLVWVQVFTKKFIIILKIGGGGGWNPQMILGFFSKIVRLFQFFTNVRICLSVSTKIILLVFLLELH